MLGVLPGIIGSLQANEVIKLIVGAGDPLIGRLLLFDALKLRFRELKLRKNPDCPICSEHPTQHGLIDYEQFCGIDPQADAVEAAFEISAPELKRWLDEGRPVTVLDVRNPPEWEIRRIDGAEAASRSPSSGPPGRARSGRHLVVHCHHGGRSAQAVNFLRQMGFSRADQPRRRHRRLERARSIRRCRGTEQQGHKGLQGLQGPARPWSLMSLQSFGSLSVVIHKRSTSKRGDPMDRPPNHDDAKLILRLYELRREPRMREARDWFVRLFHASSIEDFQRLCPPGSEANRFLPHARPATGRWSPRSSPTACSTRAVLPERPGAAPGLGAGPRAGAQGSGASEKSQVTRRTSNRSRRLSRSGGRIGLPTIHAVFQNMVHGGSCGQAAKSGREEPPIPQTAETPHTD